jgi:hypothetical protein
VQWGQHTVYVTLSQTATVAAGARPNNLFLEAFTIPYLGQQVLQQCLFIHRGQHTVSIKSAAAEHCQTICSRAVQLISLTLVSGCCSSVCSSIGASTLSRYVCCSRCTAMSAM